MFLGCYLACLHAFLIVGHKLFFIYFSLLISRSLFKCNFYLTCLWATRECINGSLVAHKPPEICLGYLILVAGSLDLATKKFNAFFKMCVNIPMLATRTCTWAT